MTNKFSQSLAVLAVGGLMFLRNKTTLPAPDMERSIRDIRA